MTTCIYCGHPIIFRYRRQLPNGTWEVRSKPFPIHVDGNVCKKC